MGYRLLTKQGWSEGKGLVSTQSYCSNWPLHLELNLIDYIIYDIGIKENFVLGIGFLDFAQFDTIACDL